MTNQGIDGPSAVRAGSNRPLTVSSRAVSGRTAADIARGVDAELDPVLRVSASDVTGDQAWRRGYQMSPTVKPSGNGSSGSTTYVAIPVIQA